MRQTVGGKPVPVAGDAKEKRRLNFRIGNRSPTSLFDSTEIRGGQWPCDHTGENSRGEVQNVVIDSTAGHVAEHARRLNVASTQAR